MQGRFYNALHTRASKVFGQIFDGVNRMGEKEMNRIKSMNLSVYPVFHSVFHFV